MSKQVDQFKPVIAGIGRSNAVFQPVPSITYSQAGITYSQVGQVYGGSTRRSDIGGIMVSIKRPYDNVAIPIPPPPFTGMKGMSAGLLLAITMPN